MPPDGLFICIWCAGGAHTHCLGPACECAHDEVPGWIDPARRQSLRNGAVPRDDREADYQRAYRAHLEDRRAADDRRG